MQNCLEKCGKVWKDVLNGLLVKVVLAFFLLLLLWCLGWDD